jgi:hypothetical protein
MQAFNGILTIFTSIADSIAASRRASEFTCGDCERNKRCGLPPNVDCLGKAAQLARDGEFHRMAPRGYYKAVWPR